MPNLTHAIAAGLAAFVCLQSSSTGATEAEDRNPVALETSVPARLNPLGIKPLDASALAHERGGTQIVSDVLLKGVVADNRVTNVVTGNNLITDGAFSGASGLPIVIQNSGSNVLIQNATIVNVQLK